jgi:uncharacterized membrane protein
MRRLFIAIVVVFGFFSFHPRPPAWAGGLEFCNDTLKSFSLAFGYERKGVWVANGWYEFKPGECGYVITSDLKNRIYYYHAHRSDGVTWPSDDREGNTTFCTQRSIMNNLRDDACPFGDPDRKTFGRIDAGEYLDYRFTISMRGERLPKIRIEVIHEQCLWSWDGEHHVHSVGWDGVTMKKLRHCIKLQATGPVEIEGVAKRYITKCVNDALTDDQTEYIVKGILALGADVVGAGGSATVALLTDYVYNVQKEAISCLTDTDRIEEYFTDVLADQFDAVIENESHWEYWKV